MLQGLWAAGREPLDVLWLAAGRAIEARVLDPLERERPTGNLRRVSLGLERPGQGAPAPRRLAARGPAAFRRARRALREARSEVLLALGGAVCVPAVLAARSLGLPVCLLEVNAVAGRATRLLGPLSQRVAHAWPTSLPARGEGRRHLVTGPPLGAAFTGPPSEAEARRARRALDLDPEQEVLLVLGGSQGARALNRFVVESVERWTGAGVQVVHQCGPGRSEEAASPRPGYRAREYIDDVAQALAAATVVLCRGGASTLAEVGARARPAWVVPYPHHADRHQEANARALGAGARVVPQSVLGPELADELLAALRPPARELRERMSRALEEAVPTDGAAVLGRELERLARGA